MAISASVVTVTTSPVQLTVADTNHISGQAVAVNNTGSVTVYLGPSNVTTSTGYPLTAGSSIALSLDPGDDLYAVAGSSTTINVLRLGV